MTNVTLSRIIPVFLVPLVFLEFACSTSPGASDRRSTTGDPLAIPRSEISTLALPPASGIPRPAGRECNLTILDWAGFPAAASWSFDDGQPSHVTHWPALKATAVPVTLYLCDNSGNPKAIAAWKDALASGSELGNHTSTHKQVADYKDDAAMAADVQKCEAWLASLGQTQAHSFAFPFGDLAWTDALGEGFLLGRSVYGGTILAMDDTDPLALPIYPVSADQTREDFQQALDDSIEEQSWVIFMFHSLLPGDNWWAGVKAKEVTASMEYGKTTAKVWQDTVQRIGCYWLGQKILAETEAQAGTDGVQTWTWTLPAGFSKGSWLRVRTDGGSLWQNGRELPWNDHGFYEVALDAGRLEWKP